LPITPPTTYYYVSQTVIVTGSSLTAKSLVYTDSLCAHLAGTSSDSYTLQWSAGTLSGISNVAQMDLTYSSSVNSTGGGSGITVTKVPDGTQSNWAGLNLAWLNGVLIYLGDPTSPKAANGYPTALLPTASYVLSP